MRFPKKKLKEQQLSNPTNGMEAKDVKDERGVDEFKKLSPESVTKKAMQGE